MRLTGLTAGAGKSQEAITRVGVNTIQALTISTACYGGTIVNIYKNRMIVQVHKMHRQKGGGFEKKLASTKKNKYLLVSQCWPVYPVSQLHV